MIKLININKTFKDELNHDFSIHNINLTIDKMDTFGIVGKSGSGKSTILNLIARLIDLDNGEIIVDNDTITNLKGRDLRNYSKSIGFIFQNSNLLTNLTLIDNVALPLKLNGVKKVERYELAKKLISYVGLENFEHRYPHQLSGGQKQRVAIARALINNPKILLCDEITTSLDYETTYDILKLINKIKEDLKLTIVFVSHDLHTVKIICNRVAIIEDGNVTNIVELNNKDYFNKLESLDYLEYFKEERYDLLRNINK